MHFLACDCKKLHTFTNLDNIVIIVYQSARKKDASILRVKRALFVKKSICTTENSKHNYFADS